MVILHEWEENKTQDDSYSAVSHLMSVNTFLAGELSTDTAYKFSCFERFTSLAACHLGTSYSSVLWDHRFPCKGTGGITEMRTRWSGSIHTCPVRAMRQKNTAIRQTEKDEIVPLPIHNADWGNWHV